MAQPKILCDTAGMDEATWRECRKHGPNGDILYTLGGSDMGTVFGISPWMTPQELWRIKRGLMEPPPKENPKQLELGHLLEPVIARAYEMQSGNVVEDDTNLYQHADFPYALANFDRRIIQKGDGAKGILECKSVSRFLGELWEGDSCPFHYELQLRYYLSVADVEFGNLAGLWGNNPETDFAMPRITRDRVMEDQIFERCDEFIWSLENDKEPTMDNIKPRLAVESLMRIYGASNPDLDAIPIPEEYEKELREIAKLQIEISEYKKKTDALEELVDEYSKRIIAFMKQCGKAYLETTNDKLLIDLVTRRQTRADTKLLKEEYPQIFDLVKKTTESRKLKVKIEAV